ncbi:MAG: YdbC family protein [Oscillospiraceae bacterium]|nr:YdbC family protein [Oscillospiraceae bacterium]
MAELTFEITKSCGIISQASSGWTKELNMVSWNGREPKYDIRDWAPDHAKMGKGVTLSADEVILLRDMLAEMDL